MDYVPSFYQLIKLNKGLQPLLPIEFFINLWIFKRAKVCPTYGAHPTGAYEEPKLIGYIGATFIVAGVENI